MVMEVKQLNTMHILFFYIENKANNYSTKHLLTYKESHFCISLAKKSFKNKGNLTD